MYDLDLYCHNPQKSFAVKPHGMALINRSFRRISLERGDNAFTFSSHFPALGLLNIVQTLRASLPEENLSKIEFRYFDEEEYDSEEILQDSIVSWLSDFSTRIVMTSTYSTTIDVLESFLGKFDQKNHLIIVGGPHVTLSPFFDSAHIVVRGEGGKAMTHLLSSIDTPHFLRDIENTKIGLCYKRSGTEHISKQSFDTSFKEIPSPLFAYDLLPSFKDNAYDYNSNFKRSVGLRSQIYVCTQSCRARCTFCSTYMIHGNQTARDIADIKEDLTYLKDHGFDSIEFHDDDLFQHPDFYEIMDILSSLGLQWFCYGRVDLIDHEISKKMFKTGCKKVFLGIESMQQAKLDYFNKKTTKEQNEIAVNALSSNNISVFAGFIIGAPNDTVESILDDLNLYLKLPLYALNCSILSPDVGTIEFRRAKKSSIKDNLVFNTESKLAPNVKMFGKDLPVGMPSVSKEVTKGELNELKKLVEVEFYLREATLTQLIAKTSRTKTDNVIGFYKSVVDSYNFLRENYSIPEVRVRLDTIERNMTDSVELRKML